MKLFSCQACGHVVYFENTACEACGAALGFLAGPLRMTSLVTLGDGSLGPAAGDEAMRYCANAQHGVCNWLVPARSPAALCIACEMNRTIPDLDVPGNALAWARIEAAKHRLIYALLRLRLPLRAKSHAGDVGIAFSFLADGEGGERVMTGHADGHITINIAEADDAWREKMRTEMGEPFRTLLGHFRHEVGHYYWDRLVRDAGRLDRARALFGDETEDYAAALRRHYEQGPPEDWQARHVSAYAAAHPWEDFAESWTHYLHIVDTLETAAAFRLTIDPAVTSRDGLRAMIGFDPYDEPDFDRIIRAWLPLTYAVNSLNRSMGLPDLYPFVLSPAAIEKLAFVHDLVRDAAA